MLTALLILVATCQWSTSYHPFFICLSDTIPLSFRIVPSRMAIKIRRPILGFLHIFERRTGGGSSLWVWPKSKQHSLRRWLEPPWPQCEATEGMWGTTETGRAQLQVAKRYSLVHLNLIAWHHAARTGTRPQTAMLPLAPSQLPLLQLHLPRSPPREALKRREKSNGLCSCKASRAKSLFSSAFPPRAGKEELSKTLGLGIHQNQ